MAILVVERRMNQTRFFYAMEIEKTLAVHGLEELFFQLCCCVSFWFWQEIGFGLTYLRT
jgi:hypothetical protein